MSPVVPAVNGFVKRKKVFDPALHKMFRNPLFMSRCRVARVPLRASGYLVLGCCDFGRICGGYCHCPLDTASPRQFDFLFSGKPFLRFPLHPKTRWRIASTDGWVFRSRIFAIHVKPAIATVLS